MSRLAILLAVLALAALVPLSRSGAGSDIVTLGLDMKTSGNGPRSAGDIDQCASVAVGEPATIDVAVPEPGIPDGRGISAYQFTLFYDGAVVSVTADNHEMLLDEVTSSVLIPIADALPDGDGIYTSGVVDFGPKGVEPGGASETGPGVLARLTLTPRAAGVSPLVIKDIIIKDDAGGDIEVISVLAAHLYAGEPCPGQAASTPTPSPAPAASPAATRRPSPAPRSAAAPAGLAQAGGPPGAAGAPGGALVVAGAVLALAGAGAVRSAAGRRTKDDLTKI